MSIMGLVPTPPGRIAGGAAYLEGEDLFAASDRRIRDLRGGSVAYVFQDPLSTLHPLFTVGDQLSEAITAHQPLSGAKATARAVELLSLVRIPNPDERLGAYPHELSGGMRQRVCIAMALANDARVLIADEPTTALDVTVQAQILTLMNGLRRERNAAILFITHDFGVVSSICDRVAVMYAGRIVETGTTEEVLNSPQHPYTARLIESLRMNASSRKPAGDEALLTIEAVERIFGGGRKLLGGHHPAVHAVQGLSLDVKKGETLGVVGESGCGKSTLARLVVGLDLPTSGTITFNGEDLTALARKDRRALARKIQYVFQDPVASLNPRKTIRTILEAPLKHLTGLNADGRKHRLDELLQAVNLAPEFLDRYPHEFSGGQAQRIGIARALAAGPELIVLDEPVSALDVSVQAQVLNLLDRLKDKFGLTYIFISHD
ncbi:UNVERIFIED_CONTAM: hypothetical protein GTU68_022668, partial [Idotea baltica]|nr:hypothetical protein [Idotea baltica]